VKKCDIESIAKVSSGPCKSWNLFSVFQGPKSLVTGTRFLKVRDSVPKSYQVCLSYDVYCTVTVTEELVLRLLLEDRGRITESIHILVPVDNQTEMFSDHDETNPSITVVSASSVACSMLEVQQQKRLCRQFIHYNC